MLIPEDILSECVYNINFVNRSERRKIEKYKSLADKIEILLKNANYKVQLLESLYSKYDNEQDDNSVTYEEILSSINSSNYMSKIVCVLHRCCDKKFEKEHFIDFIQSAPFQKTIQNEWESEDNSNRIEENNLKEERSMKYYLGYIELRRTFYNFKPQYSYNLENKETKEISPEELRDKFPEHGSVNLGFRKFGDNAYEFLKALNIDKVDDSDDVSCCTSIYAIHFNDDELEDTGNDKIRKRLDLQGLYENGEELHKRIKPILEFHFFKTVTPKDDIRNESFAGMIFINEKEYPANDDVLLEYDDK